MKKVIKVAILGSTGYVGREIVNILINHPHVRINFLGSENINNINHLNVKEKKEYINLPQLSLNKNFNPSNSDAVFLALPHGVTHQYVKKFFKKINIYDLSADFRLDSLEVYEKNYGSHSCPEILKEFTYGLFEINKKKINNKNKNKNKNNISIPGCYPTSILLPLIPLIKNNLINTNNIIIDSKSGFSGAGKNI